MGLHAYLVKEIVYGGIVFNCHHPDEWCQRLLRLNKFDNGHWMEFSAEELADIATVADLTPEEQVIVSRLRELIENNNGEPVQLQYF